MKTSLFKKISRMSNLNLEIWKLNKVISEGRSQIERIEALKELGAVYNYLQENRIAIAKYEKIVKI